jgi:peptide/nickel transport system ATP-binding protein
VQAGVLKLLDRLVDDHATALLFISHDLAVVHQVCRRVAVLGDGRVLEEGTVSDVVRTPSHAETRALIAAARATSWTAGKVFSP